VNKSVLRVPVVCAGVALLLAALACTRTASAPTVPAPTATPVGLATVVLSHDAVGWLKEPLKYQSPVLAVCDAGALNIRKSPSIKSVVVGWLYDEDVVEVFETRAGWSRIGSGWVRSKYLCCNGGTALCSSGR
jgi:hypothetical protein